MGMYETFYASYSRYSGTTPGSPEARNEGSIAEKMVGHEVDLKKLEQDHEKSVAELELESKKLELEKKKHELAAEQAKVEEARFQKQLELENLKATNALEIAVAEDNRLIRQLELDAERLQLERERLEFDKANAMATLESAQADRESAEAVAAQSAASDAFGTVVKAGVTLLALKAGQEYLESMVDFEKVGVFTSKAFRLLPNPFEILRKLV
jgi:hypothetical protein